MKKKKIKKRKTSGAFTKKQVYDFVAAQPTGVNVRTILERLKIPQILRTKMKRTLRELSSEGKIVRYRNKYSIEKPQNTVTGRIDLRNDFGFLVQPDGNDIFIGSRAARDLLPGDEIEVYVQKSRRGGKEGTLKRVVKRNTDPIMCRVRKDRLGVFAVLAFKETPVILLDPTEYKIKDNDIVLVEVHEEKNVFTGKIISHLDGKDDVEMHKKFIINKYGIAGAFSKEVSHEAEKIEQTAGFMKNRTDLRKETIITIDPFDAKDFDDAVSLSQSDGIYTLGVHIADVTSYLKEGMHMDSEAESRGVSTYLPKEVIPMLPEKLSNNICSLVEGKDRLTFSIFMDIDSSGEIIRYEIKESVINNAKRFNYEEAQRIILGEEKFDNDDILKTLKRMNELKEILKSNLIGKGMIDFSLGEPVLEYNKEGKVSGVKRKESLDSHRLIEFFMIYANICAADFMLANSKVGMYRVHPEPSFKDIQEFNDFIKALGYTFFIKKGSNKEFQMIAENIKKSDNKYFIERKLLRTMQLAKYSEKNTGHFGLGIEKYSHFTSPIRRYADVIVHRTIKHYLGIEDMKDCSKNYLKEVTIGINRAEEKSEKAENEVFKLYALNFLKNRLGDEVEVFITKITKNGFFVELEEYPVEGFIEFESIQGDYFEFVESMQMAVGKRNKKKYKLGDRFSAIISGIRLESLKMNLEIVQ